MRKVKDLAVATGSYTANDGTTKKRYANVGALMEGDNGQFLFINRHINFAGLPFKEGAESVIVSMFDLRDANGDRQSSGQTQQRSDTRSQSTTEQSKRSSFDDLDDDVPF